jgi:hypothetical protein
MNMDFLIVGICFLYICDRGRTPGFLVDCLIKFMGFSHLLHIESLDQLGDFIPVGIIVNYNIFFELRGVNDPSVPAVEFCVPSIEAPNWLT